MRIEVEKSADKELDILLGDIVMTNGNTYLVIEDSTKGYIAKSFDGYVGCTGYHDTLDKLRESFGNSKDFKHFPSTEFKLVIQKN